MIIDDLQRQVNELTEKVRQLQNEHDIIIRAMDILQLRVKDHFQDCHLKKRWKWFGFIRK